MESTDPDRMPAAPLSPTDTLMENMGSFIKRTVAVAGETAHTWPTREAPSVTGMSRPTPSLLPRLMTIVWVHVSCGPVMT